MRHKYLSNIVAFLLLVLPVMARKKNTTKTTKKRIYVIRHAEKTYDYNAPETSGKACLSQMGWGRAYNLVSLFGVPNGKFRRPQAVFSSSFRKSSCRDEHGWYRTQQTVSVVASHLNLTVHNETGINSRYCKGDETLDQNPGMRCNAWSAQLIMKELMKPSTDTILVAWEHANVPNLSLSLANYPEGNPLVEEVASQVFYNDSKDESRRNSWKGFQYDKVYEYSYDCSSSSCVFQELNTNLEQGFKWLGPTYGCGFSVPAAHEDDTWIRDYWLPRCIKRSDCPIVPYDETYPKRHLSLSRSTYFLGDTEYMFLFTGLHIILATLVLVGCTRTRKQQ